MKKLCLDCYKTYDQDYYKEIKKDKIKKYKRIKCINKKCNKNNFIEIDELMIPTIIELNKKGYKTEFCCSGHINPKSYYIEMPYLLFNSEINNIPNLPINWLDFSLDYKPIHIKIDESILSSYEISYTEEKRKVKPKNKNKFIECIFISITFKNIFNAQKFLFDQLNNLLEWAINLPEYKKYESE